MRPSFFVVVLSDNGKSRQPKAVFRQGYPLTRQDWLTWCFMVDKINAQYITSIKSLTTTFFIPSPIGVVLPSPYVKGGKGIVVSE